jgi:formylglycine-generating enzyme required for sulfatase activity
MSYAQKLAATSGLPITLPTEAQWEFAARSGGGERYGSAGSTTAALNEIAHYRGSDGTRQVAVGKLKPNAWGLYDTLGMVLEWCQDWFTAGGEFADSWNTPGWETGVPVIDPRGPATNCAKRVTRGGHYSCGANDCRAAARHPRKMTGTGDNDGAKYCGYRLAVPIP